MKLAHFPVARLGAMGLERRALALWLDALLKTALVIKYDPTCVTEKSATRLELSPSGEQPQPSPHFFEGQNATGGWHFDAANSRIASPEVRVRVSQSSRERSRHDKCWALGANLSFSAAGRASGRRQACAHGPGYSDGTPTRSGVRPPVVGQPPKVDRVRQDLTPARHSSAAPRADQACGRAHERPDARQGVCRAGDQGGRGAGAPAHRTRSGAWRRASL